MKCSLVSRCFCMCYSKIFYTSQLIVSDNEKKEDENKFFLSRSFEVYLPRLGTLQTSAMELLGRAAVAASFAAAYFGSILVFIPRTQRKWSAFGDQLTLGEVQLSFGAICFSCNFLNRIWSREEIW